MPLKKQILVVEDNEINRAVLSSILSDTYNVSEAENGQVALDFLMENKDKISLILLDVMMPVMTGFELLAHLKEDKELSLIPVIVTTQNDSEEDEIAALEHGATDFVPKPYHPQVILHRVASLISLRENAAMVNQFRYDRLTGLYSKDYFCSRAKAKMMHRPEREYTIISSDISNLKLFNDVFGVKTGNKLLCDVADMMQELTKDYNGICSRFNGDLFMMLIAEEKRSGNYDAFVAAGEKTLSKVRNASLRWGVYEVSDYTVSIEKMCDRAQLAADSIKGKYNANYAVYDDALRDKLLHEQLITESMERAVAEGQFKVYLQPKISLHTNKMAGAEALVRWIHPEMGLLSPGEFIPLFEKNGFIPELDKYVWEQTCSMISDWKKQGLNVVPVSVNVSRADIYRADLTDILISLVKKYNVDPKLLHLEITESAYTDNPDQIVNTVKNLRELGFVVEMDDFGSGYSSLSMLNQMKPDILKLDMRFVQNETSKPEEDEILRFVVELAHWLKMPVVAEGVENAIQVDCLRKIDCDYVQGYYYSKPMQRADFEEYMRKENQ